MTKIEKLTHLLADILDHFARKHNKESVKFIDAIQIKFGFETKFGWNQLLNAIYILQDTEMAKAAFRKFSLQGPGLENDIGERYLRLYGILNAYYLQKNAAINLVEIFKVSNKDQIKSDLEKLNMIQLRNKIAHMAAHSSYRRENKKIDVYELHQFKLSHGEIELCKNHLSFEKYDLKADMDDFDSYLNQLLIEISKKIVKSVFNEQGAFQQKLTELLSG